MFSLGYYGIIEKILNIIDQNSQQTGASFHNFKLSEPKLNRKLKSKVNETHKGTS